MNIGIFLVALLCYKAAGQSIIDTDNSGVCTKELQGTLENRVNRADVVLTGTVIRLETESHSSGKSIDFSGDHGPIKPAMERSSTRTVAIVKLWRVVKGSLAEVANQSSRPQDLLSSEGGSSIIPSIFLKLYGLWNDQLCGSFLSSADTRIFFLKKFRDVREVNENTIKKSVDLDLLKLADKPVMLEVEADVEKTTKSIPLKETNLSKKKKKKKGKKKKKKHGGGKKKKSKKATKKKKNGRKPKKARKSRRKKRKTESVYGTLTRLSKRHRRNSGLPNKISWANESRFKVRRQATETEGNTEPRSVLVLNSSPARITLANLNSVEELSKSL